MRGVLDWLIAEHRNEFHASDRCLNETDDGRCPAEVLEEEVLVCEAVRICAEVSEGCLCQNNLFRPAMSVPRIRMAEVGYVRLICPVANDKGYEATSCGYTGNPEDPCLMAGIASGCISKQETA